MLLVQHSLATFEGPLAFYYLRTAVFAPRSLVEHRRMRALWLLFGCIIEVAYKPKLQMSIAKLASNITIGMGIERGEVCKWTLPCY